MLQAMTIGESMNPTNLIFRLEVDRSMTRPTPRSFATTDISRSRSGCDCRHKRRHAARPAHPTFSGRYSNGEILSEATKTVPNSRIAADFNLP